MISTRIAPSLTSLRSSIAIRSPSYQIIMKSTIISLALSLLLPLSTAAPSSNPLSARQTNGALFQGAAGASFVIDNVPQDNTIFNISTSIHPYSPQSYQSPINGTYLASPRPLYENLDTSPDPPHCSKHIANPNTPSLTANPLSISYISTTVPAVCTFHGIDGSSTTVVGDDGQNVAVGPPQTQLWGACLAFSFPGQLCEGTDPSIECSPHLPPGA